MKALEDGAVDSIMVNMYLPVKRKDLFNWTTVDVDKMFECETLQGIILNEEAVSLAKDIEKFVASENVQAKYLLDNDDQEEVCSHEKCSTFLYFRTFWPLLFSWMLVRSSRWTLRC